MIATLVQLKLYLWITSSDKDALLQLFLDWANQIIETYLWRTISSDNYTEIRDWDGQLFLMLKNIPVTTMTSVHINTWTISTPVRELIPATDYSVDTEEWRINFFVPLCRGFKNYKIMYTAWYSTIPADLVLASCKMASKYYNSRSSDWISSESVAWDSITFDISQVPNDILVVLSNYRDM